MATGWVILQETTLLINVRMSSVVALKKYHPNQINSSKLNQEKKEETSLQKMETELGSQQSVMRSPENAQAHKIEPR